MAWGKVGTVEMGVLLTSQPRLTSRANGSSRPHGLIGRLLPFLAGPEEGAL